MIEVEEAVYGYWSAVILMPSCWAFSMRWRGGRTLPQFGFLLALMWETWTGRLPPLGDLDHLFDGFEQRRRLRRGCGWRRSRRAWPTTLASAISSSVLANVPGM